MPNQFNDAIFMDALASGIAALVGMIAGMFVILFVLKSLLMVLLMIGTVFSPTNNKKEMLKTRI